MNSSDLAALSTSDLAALAAAGAATGNTSGLVAGGAAASDVNAILLEAAVRQQVEARRLANEKALNTLLLARGHGGTLGAAATTPSFSGLGTSSSAAAAAAADAAVSLSVTIRQKKLKEINDQMQLLQSLKAAPVVQPPSVAASIAAPTATTPSLSAGLPPSLPPPDYRSQIRSIDDQMKQMQEMFNNSRNPPPPSAAAPQSNEQQQDASNCAYCAAKDKEADTKVSASDEANNYPIPDASEQTEVTLDTASNDAEGKAAALASATTSLRGIQHQHDDTNTAPQSPRSSGKGLRGLFRGRGRRRSGTGSTGGGGGGGISSFFGQKKVYLQQIDTEIASMKEMLRELEISRDQIAHVDGSGAATGAAVVGLNSMSSDISQSKNKQRMRSSSPSWRTGLSSKFPRKKSPAPPRKKVRHHSPER